ncbi:MAG TPA: tyrosine-type recombinase/integrase, partial [Candidatus Thermoplasmatota archaeon]|nr:tyrosine-type recombinase/integrase [Candidatus Thermoplasmatota archaeon]
SDRMGCTHPPYNNNNIYGFTYIPPLKGVDNQEKQLLSGGRIMQDTLQRYKDYLCGEHDNENTRDSKITAIRIFLRRTKEIINQETLQEFKIWFNKHYQHNSRNNRINSLNQFFRWIGQPELQMKHIGFIETNQHALNEQEMDLLITLSEQNPLEHLIIMLLFDGPLRPSEIINIQINQREKDILYLKNTKTGNKDKILSPEIQKAWDNYLQIRPQPKPGNEQYLILKDKYKQKGYKYQDTDPINDMIHNVVRLAGIQKTVTAYTIRRTSGTLRANKYSKYYIGDPKLLQMFFGHTCFSTTMRYIRITDEDLRRYHDEQQRIRCKSEVSGINTEVSDINLIYSPQDLNIYNEGDDNSSVSFSCSFSFIDFLTVLPTINNIFSARGIPGLALIQVQFLNRDIGEGCSSNDLFASELFLNNNDELFSPSPFSSQGGF